MKTYFKNNNVQLTDKGMILNNIETYSFSQLTNDVNKNVKDSSQKFRAILLLILSSFVYSQARITHAPFPEELAYLVSVILIIGAFNIWTNKIVTVEVCMVNKTKRKINFKTRGLSANKFIGAYKKMMKNHSNI